MLIEGKHEDLLLQSMLSSLHGNACRLRTYLMGRINMCVNSWFTLGARLPSSDIVGKPCSGSFDNVVETELRHIPSKAIRYI